MNFLFAAEDSGALHRASNLIGGLLAEGHRITIKIDSERFNSLTFKKSLTDLHSLRSITTTKDYLIRKASWMKSLSHGNHTMHKQTKQISKKMYPAHGSFQKMYLSENGKGRAVSHLATPKGDCLILAFLRTF